MDAAFEIIQSAIKAASSSTIGANSKLLDQVNAFAKTATVLNSSEHTKSDVTKLLNDIYRRKCPAGSAYSSMDPVNEILDAYGSSRFFHNPDHSLQEWNALIDKTLESNDSSGLNATDSVNDFIAQITGNVRPSAQSINKVETAILAATYQATYKMTSGSPEHIKKLEEISKLKDTLSRLKKNIEETER
jgi:hypothetical protein